MRNNPIGFFDSGVGGLSVLRYAIEKMPEENYIYFGDSLNAPYGTKSKEEVFSLTENGVKNLVKQGAKAVVVACNTATSIAVDRLRKDIKIPIISMEPAIKPALEQTNGKVLLLATSVTVSSTRVNALIDKYDIEKRVIKIPCPELAKKIEEAVFKKNVIDEYLNELLSPLKKLDATAVVLGCTHYPFVKENIKKVLGSDLKIYDGINGTISHLKDILIQNNLKKLSEDKGYLKIQSSLQSENTLELYNKLLNGGIL